MVNIWHSDYCVAHTPYMIEDTILVRPGRISPPFFDAGGIGGIIQKYNWSGDIIWETMWANNQYQQHHDIEMLPNGNILLISFDRKSQEETINKALEQYMKNKQSIFNHSVCHTLNSMP